MPTHKNTVNKEINFNLLASRGDGYEEEASFYSPITPSNKKNLLNVDLFNQIETSKHQRNIK